MSTERELVAAFEISSNANEDRWAYAYWNAQDAVKAAAKDAGFAADEVDLSSEMGGRVVIGSCPDGRQFEARVIARESIPGDAYPRRMDVQKDA
ncbi:hypothetical protein [Microbispora hainanensis]|uniref:DUF4288 domain-containing protein n=1 Tax=Microbispora hainanensis TaxID=568844 RepID=A0ABZ1SJV5_9ACTN|nr:hypothetical protein [Microbispora hainanensis]